MTGICDCCGYDEELDPRGICEECAFEGGDYWDFMDGPHFADPGGVSALRAATPSNPRNLPCPTCKTPNRLTPKDVQLGYQCDHCADLAERGGW